LLSYTPNAPSALNALDQATQNPVGTHIGDVGNVNHSERPDGNSNAYALRKLRKDRPDLVRGVATWSRVTRTGRVA